MANVFLLTTIAIVVSPSVNCERRAFLPNANNFLKAVPNHWKHDKEELNKNLVKNAGQPWEEMRVGPRPPPLHSNPPAQWILAQQNQLPVLPDKGQTLRRIEQLQNKLNNQPRSNIIQTLNHPHPKPEIEVKLHKNKRQKREAKLLQNGFRHKREVVINPQMQPELIMQSHIQPALLQKIDAKNVGHSRNFLFYNPNIYYPDIIGSLNNKSDHEQEKDAEKRDKRQILLMIKQQPLNLGKKPRTTPNPFIRDTNIADYEIGKVDIDKPEINVVDTMDTDSYQLSETSELDYESDYTISMSDSEDWDNYPLTTPSGPNPGWGLSTLADIYQRRKRNRAPIARVKRSPRMKKKIGEYKRKLKERRKRKEAKRKRRIIRNSKEDKEVKEEIKEEQIVEKLLKRPRQTAYKEEEISSEVLWSNNTHRIVEDPGAKFEWINKTHYKIFKPNATDEWYNENHVLVYDEEYWKNRTKENIKITKQTVQKEDHDEEYSEDYDEEFTKEEEEEKRKRLKKYKPKDTTNKKKKTKQLALEEFKEEALNKKDTKGKEPEQISDSDEKKETKIKSEKKTKKSKNKKLVDVERSGEQSKDNINQKKLKSKDIDERKEQSDEKVKAGKKVKQVKEKEESADVITKRKKVKILKKKITIDQEKRAEVKDKTRHKKKESISSEGMESHLDEKGETSDENKPVSDEKVEKTGGIKQSDKKAKKQKRNKKKLKDTNDKENSANYSSDESESKDSKSEIKNESKNENKKNAKDTEIKQRKRLKANTKKSKPKRSKSE